MKACDKCNIYLPDNNLLYVWNDAKECGQWLCKDCCIELGVDAEYINKFNKDGDVIE